MYINFRQTQVSRSVKTVHTKLFANNGKLHKFSTTNSNFEKIDYFRHASLYNLHVYQFSDNRVSRSVKTVHTNIFPNNRKLHKFATTNSILFISVTSDIHHCKTYMYINFQIIGLVDQSKPFTQIYLQKIVSCINLQLAIRISENHAFQTCTTP